jgi:hypothetical protein
MRTAGHDNDDLVVRGLLSTPPPVKITPPTHPPHTMDVGDQLSQLSGILTDATRLAHRILSVVHAASELQVLAMNAQASPAACSDRSAKLRDLAASLVDYATELSPSLTRAADMCLALTTTPDAPVVPGEVG